MDVRAFATVAVAALLVTARPVNVSAQIATHSQNSDECWAARERVTQLNRIDMRAEGLRARQYGYDDARRTPVRQMPSNHRTRRLNRWAWAAPAVTLGFRLVGLEFRQERREARNKAISEPCTRS